jgi:hypothetical protein
VTTFRTLSSEPLFGLGTVYCTVPELGKVGNLTVSKLRKDYLLAKESINDLSIESLLSEVKENNEKTKLGKAWECIKSIKK